MNSDTASLVTLLLALHDRRDDADYLLYRSNAMQKVAELAEKNPQAVISAGHETLRLLDQDDVDVCNRANRALHVLFDWFEGHEWIGARELVEKALIHQRFRWKERYLQVLDEFADPASLPTLLAVLRQHGSQSEVDVDIRSAVIQSLTSVFQAAHVWDSIRPYLRDPAPRVRLAATEFVWSFDITSAGDLLIARLAEEEDPSVFELILACLEKWKRTDALPACEQRLRSLDPALTDFIEPLMDTIAALSRESDPGAPGSRDTLER